MFLVRTLIKWFSHACDVESNQIGWLKMQIAKGKASVVIQSPAHHAPKPPKRAQGAFLSPQTSSYIETSPDMLGSLTPPDISQQQRNGSEDKASHRPERLI